MGAPYTALFEAGRIGGLTLKNRIVMTSVLAAVADPDGSVSDKLVAWYEERARGGAGLVITGACAVDAETGPPGVRGMLLDQRRHIAPLERLAAALHKYDAGLFVQLYHRGREASAEQLAGRTPVSASAVETRFGGTTRELSVQELEAIAQKFVRAARLAQEAGADGVEIHGAHGYLINQFLTPAFNRRTDAYGGSLANRMRFLLEILAGVREACGPGFPIGVRFSADEFYPGGNGLEEGVEIAKALEAHGADFLDVSCGLQETSCLNREPPSYEQGWKKRLAASVKAAVSIPVIGVNTIKTPEFAESLLREGVCDFVGITRGQMADPSWAAKAKAGKANEIQTCISCLTCFEQHALGHMMKCAVNPTLQRELEFRSWNRNGGGRRIAVVGGGPAGMTAAWVLAQRGFAVTLFEQGNAAGGQLLLAQQPPHKEKIGWLREHMLARMLAAGVELRLGQRARPEDVAALEPEGVFLCCGSKPVIPSSIPGIEGKGVYTVPQVLRGQAELANRRVAVIGSGLSGLETAMWLGERGCRLSIVEMQSQIGPDVYATVRDDTLRQLEPLDPAYYPGHRLESLEGGQVHLAGPGGDRVTLEADAVVLSLGVRPDLESLEPLRAAFPEAVLCGDALKGGRLVNATGDGFGKAFVYEC